MNDDKAGDSSGSAQLAEDVKSSSASSWFQAIMTRLGLNGSQTLRDTIEDALKGSAPTASSSFTDAERDMLLRLLRFGTSRVDDIMVPRADIIAIDETSTLQELLALFQTADVSRIPLYSETLDDPRGMVHVKDLFKWLIAEEGFTKKAAADVTDNQPVSLTMAAVDLTKSITTAKIRRQVLYVPPSMPASDLLIRMQATRIHMALVVDEYGGTDGLVTIEDLVEQIVGEIEDEHDEDEASNIVQDNKQGIVASARTPVKELEELLGKQLLDEEEAAEIDTLGGLVFSILGRVPARGELIPHPSGIEFEVLDADPRRVNKLKIYLPRVKAHKPHDGPQNTGTKV